MRSIVLAAAGVTALMLPGCGSGDTKADDATEAFCDANQLDRATGRDTGPIPPQCPGGKPVAVAAPEPAPSVPSAAELNERAAQAAGPGVKGGEMDIDQDDFGAAWPFVPVGGVLGCKGSLSQGSPELKRVLIRTGLGTFALNRVAQGQADIYNWNTDLDLIVKDDLSTGLTMDVTAITDLGLKLCR